MTAQLLIENLPSIPNKKEKLRQLIGSNNFAVVHVNETCDEFCLRPELVWQPEATRNPTALASNGGSLVACGSESGSITLLDIESGKVRLHRCIIPNLITIG